MIPRNADRSPRWPSGFVGSISHSRHWIFAAAARECDLASIGVDTEPIASPVQAESLQWEIGRVAEWKLLESLGLSITQAFTLLFSAKEAFYKSCYPLTKCFLDFQDVVACQVSTLPSESVDCTATGSIAMASRGAAGSELMVRYCLTDQDVFTIATASHGTVSQLP